MGYLFLLKRLANVCYLSRKYADAEKYYKVCIELMPKVTSNPANAFSANKNLLLLYTYTDIKKALDFATKLNKQAPEMLPLHFKELRFMTANVHFLHGEYMQAKLIYRELLSMDLKP